MTRLMNMLALLVKERPEEQTRTYKAMHEQLKYFAGPPIRNAAAVSGNICTGSPISDLNPIYMAAGAIFYVAGKGTAERAVSTFTQISDKITSKTYAKGPISKPDPISSHLMDDALPSHALPANRDLTIMLGSYAFRSSIFEDRLLSMPS